MKLVYADAQDLTVSTGDTLVDFRGETATLIGATPPHKPSSTGRVYVRDEDGHQCEYYPSVYGLKWVEA